MAQKVTGIIKLQINAAKATASPPVGPALGQHGVNIAAFIKEFNARTKDMEGYKIPVVITVYADRSFTFITKTPPTPMLIMKAIGLEKGSGVPNKTKVGTITKAQIAEIAKTKMPDLNCPTLEAAENQVALMACEIPGCRSLPLHGRYRRRLIFACPGSLTRKCGRIFPHHHFKEDNYIV